MDLNEYLAWRINSLAGYIPMMLRSEHAIVRKRADAYARELVTLRQVAIRRHAPETMTPVDRIWWTYLQAVAVTYMNNPRLNEAANNAARLAALVDRDAALLRLEEKAA